MSQDDKDLIAAGPNAAGSNDSGPDAHAQAASAAESLFDREPPADYLAECTENLAGRKNEKRGGLSAALFFRVGTEWLALDAAGLDVISRSKVIRRIPGREGGGLLGLVNLDGELLPCVSLARIMGGQTPSGEGASRLVCAAHQGERWVFPVDEIAGAGDYHPADVAPPPATAGLGPATFTRGIVEALGVKAGLIDIAALFAALERSVEA